MTLINANPTVYETPTAGPRVARDHELDEDVPDEFDAQEIFGDDQSILTEKNNLIRNINDPEHPLTLEQLNVAQIDHISVDTPRQHVVVRFTPTIPHCSMATLIGLCIRVRLLRALPARFKVDVLVREGTHQSEKAVNKQLNDKERVAAALENNNLLEVVNQCLATAMVA